VAGVSPGVTLGLALALAAALALDGGFVLQHQAASRLPPLTLRRPRRSLESLLAARRWLAGFVLGLGGWVLYLVALGHAPLSLVQAATASGIGLLVLGLAVARRRVPPRRESVAALIATGGLAALGLSLLGSGAARHVPLPGAGVWALAAVVAACVALLVRHGSAGAGGTAAGSCYGLGDVATKAFLIALPHHPGVGAVAASPYLWLTLASHGSGFLILQRSFQRGGVVAAVAPMTAAMNLLPIAAGVLVLGDPLPRSAPVLALRLGAFAAAAAGAALLVTREAEVARPPEPPPDRPVPAVPPDGPPPRRRTWARGIVAAAAVTAFAAVGLWSLYGYVDQYIRYRGFGPPVSTVAVARQGQIVSFSFQSRALGGRRVTPLVYVPAGYDAPPYRRYPVLYLLHGTPGDPRAAFVDTLHVGPRLDALIAAHQARPMLVVMPPGSPGTYDAATEWANGPRPGERWFTYLTRELPRAVDARFRTIHGRHGRAIAGYSSGADAAINAILWHPWTFGVAEAWSGDFRQTPRTVGHDPKLIRHFSALDTARQRARHLAHAHDVVYLYAGRRDKVLPATMAVGRDLRRAGVRVVLDETSGGHAWELWASRMDGALRFASRHLRGPR
jgi:enterochelin esterase-like enzyme